MGISPIASALFLPSGRLRSLSKPSNFSVFITSSTMPLSFNAFNKPASSSAPLSRSSPLKDSSTHSLIREWTFICDRWLWMICFSSWTFSVGRDMVVFVWNMAPMAPRFRKRKLRTMSFALTFFLKAAASWYCFSCLRVPTLILPLWFYHGLISSWRKNLNVKKKFVKICERLTFLTELLLWSKLMICQKHFPCRPLRLIMWKFFKILAGEY